jgi:hypothetical protein
MDAYTAASKAFSKCKSRFEDKNQAVAPYLAKQYLIIAGVRGEELEAATESCQRMLEEWYAHKATNGSFFPQPIETVVDDEEHKAIWMPAYSAVWQRCDSFETGALDEMDSDVADESDILA